MALVPDPTDMEASYGEAHPPETIEMAIRFSRGAAVALTCTIFVSAAWATQTDSPNRPQGHAYNFDVIVTGDSEWVINSRIKVDGTHERVDFSKSTLPYSNFRSGMFMISDHQEHKSIFIYPDEKVLLEESQDSSGNSRPSVKNNGFEEIISNPEVRIRHLGDGGIIEGFPTRKTEVRISFRRTINVPGARTSNNFESINEIWTTDKIPSEAMALMMRGFSGMPREINNLIDAQSNKLDKGFVLKRVVTNRYRKGGGKVTATRTETVSNFRSETIPLSEFAIPTDYETVKKPPARR